MEWYLLIAFTLGFLAGIVFSWFNLKLILMLVVSSATPKKEDKRKDSDYWKPEDWTPDEP